MVCKSLFSYTSIFLVGVTANMLYGMATEQLWSHVTLSGHSDKVTAAAFSHSLKKLVTGSEDCTVRLWDAQKNEPLHVLQGHTGAVRSAIFSHDDMVCATASEDHTACIWDSESGSLERTLKDHGAAVWSAEFSPDGASLVTASEDRFARIWSRETGQCIASCGHEGSLYAACFSPDGKTLATACTDGAVRLWDMTGKFISLFNGCKGVVLSVCFSKDGKKLFAAATDNIVRMYDCDSATPHSSVIFCNGCSVNAVKLSQDGSQVITSSAGCGVRFWNYDTKKQIRRVDELDGYVRAVEYGPAGGCVATAEDTETKVWPIN